MAGAIGALFGMDPVLVADEPDKFRKAFRLAAHNAEVQRLNDLHRST